jgi:hypothetical protein
MNASCQSVGPLMMTGRRIRQKNSLILLPVGYGKFTGPDEWHSFKT